MTKTLSAGAATPKRQSNIEDIYSLSPAQEGMLFHSLYSTGEGVYFCQLVWRLQDLNIAVFERAWQTVIDRHPILRTSFTWERGSRPLQVVHRTVTPSWRYEDWRNLTEHELEARLDSFLEADRAQGFDPHEAPLMRFTLANLGGGSYEFIWSHDHLLVDGWTMPILRRELMACYDAIAGNHPVRLDTPRPYRDYIDWLQGLDLGAAERHWRKRLAGFTAGLQFEPDLGAADRTSLDVPPREITVTPSATAALRNFAREHRLTLNTVVQGAWALMLSIYGRTSDLVFGAVVSGRPPELEGSLQMVGPFINTIPFRVAVRSDLCLKAWLKELQEIHAEDRQYEHTPLRQIQKWSEVPRGSTLFDTVTSFEHYPANMASPDTPKGFKLVRALSREKLNYPLALMSAASDVFELYLFYDPKRFAGHTVDHMLAQLSWLLESFPTAANRAIADLSVLPPREHTAVPPLPVRYGDLALPHTGKPGGELEKQLAWWREQLAGAPPVLELPTDRPRVPEQAWSSAEISLPLSAELTAQLRAFNERESTTLFITALAAFQLLLARYSAQWDVVVGSPDAAGLLPLRSHIRAEQSFRELLAVVRETTLAAYAHQELPFEKLVEELQPDRTLPHAPLFQLVFAVEYAGNISLNYDLSLLLTGSGAGLEARCIYNAHLFEAANIKRFLNHYQTLLEAAIANPDSRVAMLPLLKEAERSQILHHWNATQRTEPVPALAHEWFEQQAARTPEAVAVIAADRELTYAALQARSNRLAQHLRALGAGPDATVGLLLDRSPDALVAILAVLKAGSAYVPLDPLWVMQRLPWLLEDSKAAILITQHRYADQVPAGRHELVLIDGEELPIGDTGSGQRPKAQAENLAYVMYTSGSTGRPKGVAVTHRSVSVFVAAMRRWLAPEELAVVLGSTSFGFDLSVFELFVTWSYGGALLLAENALQTPELPARERITDINTVPSAIAQLLSMQAIPRSVRTITLCGEVLPGRVVRELYALGHIERIWNLYGPTEDTVYSTGMVAPRDTAAPPIGRPLLGTQAYLLDEWLQPVPVGVAGMLYLGGEGLARGYLNRPDLTAASFLPDPFASQPGARMYRTGDLSRWLPDGTIDFLGRNDFQVKIRGFRIELGEIEARLKEHDGVRGAVVIAREDTPGDKRLVAYYTCRDRVEIGSDDLRRSLSAVLPEYMVPAAYVRLESLPQTPNGKLDRKALPAPLPGADTAEQYTAPRSDSEALLAEIWQQTLGVARVGVHDNFFALGGDSILSMQIVGRAGKAGLRLHPRHVFQHQTVAELAAVAVRTGASSAAEQQTRAATLPVEANAQFESIHDPSSSIEPLFTPSDFPEAGLSQNQLDSFLDQLQAL